jgi:hypothetical protein
MVRLILLLTLAVSLTARAGIAGIMDELTPAQQQDVLAGKVVLITEDVDGAPWPKMNIYHVVKSTAEEAMAVSFDYELRTKYTPELTYAKISTVIDPRTADVDYTLELPVLGPENFTLWQQVSTYGDGQSYRLDWHLVRADRTKRSEGFSRIETLGDQAIFAVTSFIDPGNPLARLIKGQAIKQTEDAAQGFAEQVEQELAQQQDTLQAQIARLRSALGSTAQFGHN